MSLLLLPVLAQALSLTVSDVSEMRARTDLTGTYMDLTTAGRFALDLKLRRVNWTLYYAPSVTQLGVESSESAVLVLHSEGLAARLHLTPRTTLTWSEYASYGSQNFRVLAVSAPQSGVGNSAGLPSSPGAGQPGSSSDGSGQSIAIPGQSGSTVLTVPGNRTIRYGSLTSGIGIERQLGRNWAMGALASYALSGEVDSYSPVTIPHARTYQGDVWTSHALSLRDQLRLTASSRYVLIEPGAETFMAMSNIAWNHNFTARAAMSLFAAGFYVNSTDLTADHTRELLPGFGGVLTLDEATRPSGSRIAATIATSNMPVIDYQYGGINDMLSTILRVTWTRRKLSFQILGGASRSIGSSGKVAVLSLYNLSEEIKYQLDRPRHWALSVGTRQAWQSFSTGQQLPMQWVAFLAISYTTGAIPF